jgi:hypothetical protein
VLEDVDDRRAERDETDPAGDVNDVETRAGRADERTGAALETLVADVFPDLVGDEPGRDPVDGPRDPGLVVPGLVIEEAALRAKAVS